MENLRVLPLHKHKEYVSDCVKLLNSEWPRSETLRLKSLEASCDSLPTYLVMVYTFHDIISNTICSNGLECCKCNSSNDVTVLKERNSQAFVTCTSCSMNHKDIVVGHSKISKLSSIPEGCFIESVVVRKEHRGKGWGKFLMEKVEQLIKQLGGIKIIFLTTIDKQSFYNKLGYKETEPIPLFGGPLASNSFSLNAALNRLRIATRSSSSNPAVPVRGVAHSFNFLISTSRTKPTELTIIPNGGKCGKQKDKNGISSNASQMVVVSSNQQGFLSQPTPPPPPPPPISMFDQYCQQNKVKINQVMDSKKTFMMKLIV